MKILNLYAGIGGNRKLWGDDHEITAVENNSEVAAVYQKNFPNDTVIVGDAHEYLLEHYEEFDFIWSSPPCPTHGQLRYRTRVLGGTSKPVYPDMRLYQEIILLLHHYQGKWIVENVEPYYTPLIPCVRVGRHFVWSNFVITEFSGKDKNPARSTADEMEAYYGIETHGMKHRRLALRNCTLPEMGLHVFKCAFKEIQVTL